MMLQCGAAERLIFTKRDDTDPSLLHSRKQHNVGNIPKTTMQISRFTLLSVSFQKKKPEDLTAFNNLQQKSMRKGRWTNIKSTVCQAWLPAVTMRGKKASKQKQTFGGR